ncbi:substrate binding domain-containing protein [Polyangium jinanense]|uniref:substrate binding domain-containing protein n=1 Tax=Polyangium jinanense TaxID=2829994 RepID=UPI00234258E7|nr:substrate binding domain-containing protein [Polyangium jinanense]
MRIGRLGESNLIAKKLGASRIVHVAAPSYVKRRGAPKSPRDLARHDCVGYLRDGRPAPFQFTSDEGTVNADIRGPFHANDAEALRELAIAGKGIVALFDFLAHDAVARGDLVFVLEKHPGTTWPIHALYPKSRHLLPKVAVLLEFVTKLFAPAGRSGGHTVASSFRK